MKFPDSSSQQDTPTLASQLSDVLSGIPNQHIDSVESTVNIPSLSDFLPSGRGFKIAGLKINSLTKHIDELRILIADYSIDIFSINETKLGDSIKSCEVHIPGYEFIRCDRNRHGGGVGFYIKTSINLVVRSDLNVFNLEYPESLMLASAIIALFMFIENYLPLFHQEGFQPFLTEIFTILIERVFVTILLSSTGLVLVLMIQMFCGLTGKRNF